MRSFLDLFVRQAAEVPTSRDDHGLHLQGLDLHGLHLKAFIHAAAPLMVTMLTPTLEQVRATHATAVAEVLADALQFKGPPSFPRALSAGRDAAAARQRADVPIGVHLVLNTPIASRTSGT
jgi:hypothetical protein